MKKLFALVAVAMLAATSFAQTEAGHFFFYPKVGGSFSNMVNSPENCSTRAGLAVGIGGGYQVSDRFAITADVLYSMQGTEGRATTLVDQYEYELEHKIQNDYINVPIMANFYIVRGLAIKAGIQPGILVDGKAKEKFNALNIDKTYDYKDIMNKVDFSIPVGISYEYKNFILDARYTIGLSNVYKETPSVFSPKNIGFSGFFDGLFKDSFTDKKNQKNGVIQITLGYKFQL